MTEKRATPSLIGLAMVMTGALIMAVTVWVLPGSHGDKAVACGFAAAMAVGAAAWHSTVGRHKNQLSLVGYPMILFIGIGITGATTSDIAFSYAGFLTMGIIFVGLYSSARVGYLMLGPIAASWLCANGVLAEAPLRSIEVRLPIALVIWFLVISLLSEHSAATVRSVATLKHQAQRDPLTGLLNRRTLPDVLEGAVAGDVIILLDIDHFKAVNDDHGHAAGDELLTDFARVLVRDIRAADLAVRFGGDEFLLFLPKVTVATAEKVLERFRRSWADEPYTTTFSAGIAEVQPDAEGGDKAFREADHLLYEAKAAGRNRWSSRASLVDESGALAPKSVSPGQ